MPVYCKTCQIELDESLDIGIQRMPCPICGSTSRTFVERLTISAKAFIGISMKHRRGKGKPICEAFNEPSLFKKCGKLVVHERVIDRENDLYREVVTDPDTGKVIHQCEEPLSEHIGHGSAKRRPKTK